MRLHRDEDGLTLIELALGTLLLGMLALATQNAALAVGRWVDIGGSSLQQDAAFGRALQVLSEDLRQPAASGIAIGGATYNTASTMTLAWTDRTTTPTTSYAVSYAISGNTLVRTLTKTQGLTTSTTTLTVARDLDPAGASGGAQFSRTAGAPGVVRVLLTVKPGTRSAAYDLTVEQRP